MQAELRMADGTNGAPAGVTVSQTFVEWLTVERAAYAGVTMLALGVRLHDLGSTLLAPAAAIQALPAWSAASARPFDLTGISPLLFGLQRLLFTSIGASDASARFLPALLGGLTPLLFYGLRDRLGRGGALMAALLWAISPMAIFAGRTGLGYGLVPPIALAFFACLNLFARERSSRWLVWTGIMLGLLLASGPGAYTVLLAFLLGAVIWRKSLGGLWGGLEAGWKRLLLAAVLSLLFASTFFLAAPSGLAAAADLLGKWVTGFGADPAGYSAWSLLRRLALSELLVVGFGIGGLVMAARRRDPAGLFAALIAGLALAVPLLSAGRHPADLGLTVLALTALAGPAVAWTLSVVPSWRREIDPWLLIALSLVLLSSAVMSLPSYFAAVTDEYHRLYSGVGIGTFALAIALWVIYGVWGSWRTVGRVLPVLCLIIGLAWNIDQLSALNFDRGAGREAAVLLESPAGGLLDLKSEMHALSGLNRGGANEAQTDLVLPLSDSASLTPMMRWVLRDLPALRVLTGLPSDPASLVITVADKEQQPGEQYSGTQFAVLRGWQPESMTGFDEWLRWILYREAKTPVQEKTIVLWADRTKQ